MGCCLGRDRGSFESDDLDDAITIGKNRPLGQDKLKWKSDVPMTEGQLRSKRDEFWETAPAFEGRKEIWDALRAASTHAEQGDFADAQAILDAANVSLPDGTLRESYDELGNRYQVPVYCLSSPLNLVEERSESSAHHSEGIDPSLVGASTSCADGKGELLTIKFRLSTSNDDIKMDVRSLETVYQVKYRLHQMHSSTTPPPNQQRWFFGGRVLLDKMRIEECAVPANFVVQVVVSSRPYNQLQQNGSGSLSEQNSRKARRHRQRSDSAQSGSPAAAANGNGTPTVITGPASNGAGAIPGSVGRRSKHGKHHHHRTRSRNSNGSNASSTNNPQQKRRHSSSTTVNASPAVVANDSPPPVETH